MTKILKKTPKKTPKPRPKQPALETTQTRATRKTSRKSSGKPITRGFTAANADKHDLYQRSVQDTDAELKFVERVFRSSGRKPLRLREDFCGTALMCGKWVSSDQARLAVGLDLDRPTLDWGLEHNLSPLGDAVKRVTLLEQDVCAPVKKTAKIPDFDVTLALNFSYWVFKTRDQLRAYFKNVLRSLAPDGYFILDSYGGWEAQEPMFEPRKIKGGFTYVWDQDGFDPISHDVLNHIHFEFKDGTKLEHAFSYDWRFWTLPEIQEVLTEAGFAQVEVWWDDTSDEQDADYKPRKHVSNQPGWIAYIVASPTVSKSRAKAALALEKSKRRRGPGARNTRRS